MDLKKLKEIDYQGIAIQHCEKAGIAVVGCLLVLFMLSALKNYRASSEITPQRIKELAEKINNSVTNSRFDAKSAGIENPNLRAELDKLFGGQRDFKDYDWAQWYWKFQDFGGVYRDQPEILKPYSLLTRQDRGAAKLYTRDNRGEFILEDPQQARPKPKPKTPTTEETKTTKKAAAPPKTAAKGAPGKSMGRMAGGGMPGGGAGGMGMGMGMGMGGDMGMGMAGGAGGQSGGPGDGMMPGMGAGRGRGGFGAADMGENLRSSIAQTNVGSGRRQQTSLDDSLVGEDPEEKADTRDAKGKEKAVPEKRQVRKEVVRGFRWVMLTALFPHAEQVKKYKDALHEDEYPDYRGFKVERRQLQSDGTFSDWAPVSKKEIDKVTDLLPERWMPEHSDIVAAKALFADLVHKVPPLRAGRWEDAVRQEAYDAARKVLGGGTGNRAATGGGIPGEGEGGMGEGEAEPGEDPNAGTFGRMPTSAGMSGAGFTAGQAGAPPGGRAGGQAGTPGGRGMPGASGYATGRGMPGATGSGAAGGVAGGQTRANTGNAPAADKSATKKPIQSTKAEIVMLRFVDYTVEPEHTYQYRLKVWVTNPNYNHGDVVDQAISQAETLEGDWSDPSPPVYVEEDMKYYVLEKTKLPPEAEKSKPPEAKFEIHKWFADLAEWQLESFTVRPGDTIGKKTDHFVVSFDNPPEKRKTEVDFGTDDVVLDVMGGSRQFVVDKATYTENIPADVLVVDRFGELASHNEIIEKNNSARKDRKKSYDALIATATEPDKERRKGDSASEANKAEDFEGNRVPTRKD